ncbi:cysteine desulfhydrase [Chromatiales bacterium (ex Bugula neritina AB1)]|nr:cysteine desulfhydrase [Chromatiales bacterium (ex Bugula neritina AB1)]
MALTSSFPSVSLAHKPTVLEQLHNVSSQSGVNVWIKRDDCTGLLFGGNKARQLEYYIGQALEEQADVLLTTGAVQSNHVRSTVAAARKLGIDVEVQLENRVSTNSAAYHNSGNALLVKLMGATVHHIDIGDDEDAADKALDRRADVLREDGRRPYIIPLSNAHTPWGALGYVEAAEELLKQQQDFGINVDHYVVASGSASTHAGLLTGLRASGSNVPVHGICVRRDATSQIERVKKKSTAVARLLNLDPDIATDSIICHDDALWPGYGMISDAVADTLKYMAQSEGIVLDPTYTAKSFHGLRSLVKQGVIAGGETVVYIHTGGSPAIFAYPELTQG